MKNCGNITVALGVMSFDENTIRSKSLCGVRSSIPSKPVKYGIRFYVLVGWKLSFVHNLWNNGLRIKTNIPSGYSYLLAHLRLPVVFLKKHNKALVDEKKASVLW